MDAGHWKRIEEIYHAVLEFPAEERAAELDRLCATDDWLRREVSSLLQSREDAGGFLRSLDAGAQLEELACGVELTGETLGHYQILQSVGSGAMGEVYLARDTRLERRVALKILPGRFTKHGDRVARFQREAKLASALNHPNIIAIYDIGQVGQTWYLAAEFVEGETIRDRLRATKLKVEEAVEIAIQCAAALDAAHQSGIIHRDIKPENIMIRRDGVVKVVDFGLARIADPAMAVDAEATASGALIGTPRYMSPEQARGLQLDARTDIFSLSAVLFEMIAGQPAVPGSTTAEVFAALLSPQRRMLSEACNLAPSRLDPILAKGLHSNAESRYRTMAEFAADLKTYLDGGSVRTVDSPMQDLPGQVTRRAWAGGILAAGGLGFGVYLVRRTEATRTDEPASSVVPLTSFAGNKDFGAFSPDGNRIAFSWNGGQGDKPERNIYAKSLGTDEPVQLTFGSKDHRKPEWSPDGSSIAFCRRVQGQLHDVCIIPAAGGTEKKVFEGGMGVSWSPDGKTLAVVGVRQDGGSLHLIELSTGQRKTLTYPAPYTDSLPVFSPDGKWILFTREFGFAAREILVIPAAGGTAKQLTFDKEPTYGATWAADSSEVIFSSNRGRGGECLWRVPASGGEPKRLSESSTGNSFYPSISRKGNRLVYTVLLRDTNVYGLEGPGFQGGIPGRFGEPDVVIRSSRRDDSPSLSPSGDRIAFVSKRTGNEEVWVSDARGNGQRQLTSFSGPGVGTPRWSPDGKWLAFDSLASGNPDIFVMSSSGGPARRLTTGSSSNFMPSWSPDGKWVLFKSDRSGVDQIWKIAVSGGDAVQVTRGGGAEGFASPDGKLLYFIRRGFSQIWQGSIDGGNEHAVPELEGFARIYRSWGVVREGIYFISREDKTRQTIRFFSFGTRQVKPLLVVDKDPVWTYPVVSLSSDGKRLLYAALDQEVNDLMLIENFR